MRLFGYKIEISITKDGKPTQRKVIKKLEARFLSDVLTYGCGNKIELIKLDRALSDRGLRESKDFVEATFGPRLEKLYAKYRLPEPS